VSPEVSAAYAVETHAISNRRARTTCFLTIGLYTAFILVDLVIFPDLAVTFWWTNRVPLVLLHSVLLGLTWTVQGKRHPDIIAMIAYSTIGVAIVDLTLRTGGGASGYYAGLSCVVLGYSVLMPWGLREAIITSTLVYVSYLGGTLLIGPIGDTSAFITNNCFLLSAIVIGMTATWFQSRLRKQEFISRQELASAHEKLKEMDAYKSQFFSNITHELRTPLTLILSPVEAILEGAIGHFEDDQMDYFKGIHRNALRLLKLINDLLDLAKLEESRARLKVSPTDIGIVVSEIAETCKPLAVRKQIDFVCETDAIFGVDVQIDRDKIERVLINLLANAFKFTSPEGTVRVTSGRVGNEVWFAVEDSGIGIPEDQQARIFDRFSQVDQSRTRKYGGTGIGLALVRELVLLHGGRIEVSSQVGVGTTMRVTLIEGLDHLDPQMLDRRAKSRSSKDPKRADDRGIPEWTAQIVERKDYRFLDVEDVTDRRLISRGPASLKAHKILVVEDNTDMIRFIDFQLRDQYQVVTAVNGAEGLEVARRELPDLIVSDLMMPVMDGNQMCAHLKTDPKTAHIPIVLLTAKSDVGERIVAHETGADTFLAKPFSPKELRAIVAQKLKSQGEQGKRVVQEKMESLELVSAGLAHEINNPLNFMKNAIIAVVDAFEKYQKISEVNDDPMATRTAEKLSKRVGLMRDTAEKGVTRIRRVVDLMRRYSREGYTRHATRTDLAEAINDTTDMLSAGVGKEVALIKTLDPNVIVEMVPEELHQILTNIIQNALDACDTDGNVWVTLTTNEVEALVIVRDDGPGIAPEHLAKIFTPFFSTKGPGGGMGLGLAIVYNLVEQAGGHLQVQSELGVGAQFSISIPLMVDQSGEQTKGSADV
jgi:signal transduction histidine kinase